jgi:hypothetical protein
MKRRRKSEERNLVVLGAALSLFFILVVVGGLWSYVARRDFFIPSWQRAHCRRNLELIAEAKDAWRKDFALTNGASISAEQVADTIEGGWKSARCPRGGTYHVGVIGERPRCSFPGHSSD